MVGWLMVISCWNLDQGAIARNEAIYCKLGIYRLLSASQSRSEDGSWRPQMTLRQFSHNHHSYSTIFWLKRLFSNDNSISKRPLPVRSLSTTLVFIPS